MLALTNILKYWKHIAVVIAVVASGLWITGTIRSAYTAGAESVKHEVLTEQVKEYKHVRQKADRVVKPRNVDDAKRVLREYKARRNP